MSTSWLPIVHVPYDENNFPPGLVRKITPDYPDHVCLTDTISYIFCYKTPNAGLEIEQFGRNQEHYEMIVKFNAHYKTKFMSYIGQPWDDLELDNIKYSDLHKREFPTL